MKRFTVALFLAVAVWLSSALPASALCGDGASSCFWRGLVNANWNQVGNWSDTSGGVANAVAGPAAGDAACFDSGGNVASTLNASFSVRSANFLGTCTGGPGAGGPYTQTLTHSASVNLTITGDDAGASGPVAFAFSSGMAYSATNNTRDVIFTSTSGNQVSITSNGKSFGELNLNGAGGLFVPTDAVNAILTTFTAGRFNAATNNAVVTSNSYSATGAGTRTVDLGTGLWTANIVSGSLWDFSGTNITLNIAGSTLSFSGTPTGGRSINFGGATSCAGSPCAYNIVSFAAGASNMDTNITASSPTFATWNATAPLLLRFSANTTVNLTNGLSWAGTSATSNIALTNIQGILLTIASAAASVCSNCVLSGVAYSGGGSLAATSSYSIGNIGAGVTVTGPSGGRTAIGM